MDVWIYIGVVFFLLLLSAFFSASETAFTSISKARIHRLSRKGQWSAKVAYSLKLKVDKVIGTILLGNNLVNILATSLMTSVFIYFFSEGGVTIATIIMTILILLFAELMPKLLAISYPEKVAFIVSPILRVFVVLLAPLTRFLRWISEKLLGLLGLSLYPKKTWISDIEELRGIIDLHSSGRLSKEQPLLNNILNLSQVTLEDVMVHRKDAEMFSVDEPLNEILNKALKSAHNRFPIWEHTPENIVGSLHSKTLLKAIQETDDVSKLEMRQVMSPPWFVPESTSLLQQMQEFKKRREHLAMVVDEYGCLQGIVTLKDVLEEIVGDIVDEHDDREPIVKLMDDGSYVVEGGISLRDLNKELSLELPDEHATTIAGLLLHEARELPDAGRVFRFYGIQVEVLSRERQQINLLKLTKVDFDSSN